jgi:hypothetical protein
MDSIGGHGTMRVQEVGARKWAVYTYEAGDSMALLDAKAVY